MPVIYEPRVLCEECEWVGYYSKLKWFPFNPVCEFMGIDSRDNPDNPIKFRKICPQCGSDDCLQIT